jgi:hypothetical protein
MPTGHAGDATPRRVPRQAPTSGYVHPDRAAAHQDALARVRQEEARLQARYPSHTALGLKMAPVPPDPADVRRYPSMPGGSAEQPRPAPTVAKPATAPTVQPAPKPTMGPTTAPAAEAAPAGQGSPIDAAVELPAQFAGMTLPENFTPDPATFGSAAKQLAEAGLDRRQAETAVRLYADLQRQRDQALEAEERAWHAESARLASTPEAREAIATAMRTAPPELGRLLDTMGISRHPTLTKWLLDIGRRLGPLADPQARRFSDWR